MILVKFRTRFNVFSPRFLERIYLSLDNLLCANKEREEMRRKGKRTDRQKEFCASCLDFFFPKKTVGVDSVIDL